MNWIAGAPSDNGKGLVVRPDEKLDCFSRTRICDFRLHRFCLTSGQNFFQTRSRYADLNQAEDLFPAGFFASSGPSQCRNQNPTGRKGKTMNLLIHG
jgi:hypothetical protein